MAAEHFFQRRRNFADGGLGASGVDRQREQVAVAAVGGAGQRVERFLQRRRIALGAQPLELVDLHGAHGRIIDPEHVDRVFVPRRIFVDADHGLYAGIDARLRLGRGFLDPHFGDAGLDRLGHAAERFDFLDMVPGFLGEIVGQPLDVIGAAPRIDDAGRAGFLLQHDLGVARDARRIVGRQRQRLVERIGVQRLGLALGRRHRLDHGAGDVVVDVLRGERPAGGLRMRAQHQRLVALRLELLDQLRPQHARGALLGDLHEVVHAGAPEERDARRELVDGRARP